MSSNFSPEAQCKLAIIEENSTLNKDQYKVLKQYSGTSELRVNIKYIPEYNVRNNMSIILISNEEIPMYVEASELPTDERNNQFFMYRCTKVANNIDPMFEIKLKERLGHYVRTELKRVFEATDYTQGRYGIRVPITQEERDIFRENRTRLEELSEELLAAIENELTDREPTHNHYQNMLLSGFVATGFAKQIVGQDALSVLKHLAKKGVLGEAKRGTYGNKAYRGRFFKNIPDEIKQKLNFNN